MKGGSLYLLGNRAEAIRMTIVLSEELVEDEDVVSTVREDLELLIY